MAGVSGSSLMSLFGSVNQAGIVKTSKALAWALGTGLAPVTWWLVGDLTSAGFTEDQLDYFIRSPKAWDEHALTAGIAGAVVAGTVLARIGWLAFRNRLTRPLIRRLALAAAIGAYAGFAGRVLTAGGIGANIGAGLIMILTLAGIVTAVVVARDRRRTPG